MTNENLDLKKNKHVLRFHYRPYFPKCIAYSMFLDDKMAYYHIQAGDISRFIEMMQYGLTQ